MHQNGIEKYFGMRIRTDAIIANQCDTNSYFSKVVDNNVVELISTNTRGTSRNRNFGLLYARADIVHFADDDMIFEKDYPEKVFAAFEKYPNADAIVFNNISTNKERPIAQLKKAGKVGFRNVSKYGVWGVFFKREVLLKHNLWFNAYFGPGSKINSGEDSLFLMEFFQKKLKMYAAQELLSVINQEESTWFTGVDEEYIFNKGNIFAAISKMPRLTSFYHAIKHRKIYSEFGIPKAYRIMLRGIKNHKK
jgi:glycosyltransferase involved in cell wall biosynthesis